jgi:hypothetical protein
MIRHTVFVPLIHVAKTLGLPRGWLLRQVSDRHIPHLAIGRDVYLHHETVVDCIVEMMKRNVITDNGLTLLEDDFDPSAGSFNVRGAAPMNYDSARINGKSRAAVRQA